MLSVELLGSFALRANGLPLGPLPRKAQGLLAYLATRPERPATREFLATLLWSESESERARHSLRQTLVAIRAALGPAWRSAIVAADGLMFRPLDAEIDLQRFEALRRSARLADLRAAAELYRGDFLAHLEIRSAPFEDWVAAERARLHAAICETLEMLAAAELEAGNAAAALAAARRLTAIDPFYEPGHRLIMRSQAVAGRRVEALRQYALCAEILKRELDTLPEDETAILACEIQRRGAALASIGVPVAVSTGSSAPRLLSPLLPEVTSMSTSPETSHPHAPAFDLAYAGAHASAAPRSLDFRPAVSRRLSAGLFATAAAGVLMLLGIGLAQPNLSPGIEAVAHLGRAAGSFVRERIVGETTPRPWAHDARAARLLYLQGRATFRKGLTAEAQVEARTLLRRAVEADPGLAEAWAWLAYTYTNAINSRWSASPAADLRQAEAAATQALALAPQSAHAHQAAAAVLHLQPEKLEAALAEYRQAIRLDHDLPTAHANVGQLHILLGRAAEGEAYLRDAIRLKRNDFFLAGWYRELGTIDLYLGRGDNGAAWFEMAAELGPAGPLDLSAYLASAYALSGREVEARAALAEFLRQRPAATIAAFKANLPSRHPAYLAYRERFYEGLRLAGLRD